MDFTLESYSNLCQTLTDYDYKFLTFNHYFDSINKGSLPEKFVLLRHDVDRMKMNSLQMSLLEKKMEIPSTYYFRDRKCSFDKEIITTIEQKGHEVGYHYENLSDAKGNIEKAKELFSKSLVKLRAIAKITTVCMHGSPLSKYDNRDFWRSYKIDEFNLKGEAYLDIDYSNILYFTDTGRSWDGHTKNLKDFIPTHQENQNPLNIKTTKELIHFLQTNHKPVIIQTHPERWSYNILTHLMSFSLDFAANSIKYVIKKVRNK